MVLQQRSLLGWEGYPREGDLEHYNKSLKLQRSIMKLVSVNAVLIASANISLFVNSCIDQKTYPPLSLFLLSTVFIFLILLLQYEHRQFKQTSVNIRQSSQLLRKYLWAFAAGLLITFSQKSQWIKAEDHPKLKEYTQLGQSLHYSMLYYGLNVFLGVVYQYLFLKEYKKANKTRMEWFLASPMEEENCSICLNPILQGQKLAKIECMHFFHLLCMNKWVKQKTQCPLCQSNIALTD